MENIFRPEQNTGSYTRQADDFIWEWKSAEVETVDEFKKMMQNGVHFCSFSDGLTETLAQHGCSGTDSKELVRYLMDCAERNQVDLTERSVKKWLKGTVTTPIERENVYKICFALNFSLSQTATFFYQVYFDRPFNTRNISEAVYLYCMNCGKSYSDAQTLITAVNGRIRTATGNRVESTLHLSTSFLAIRTDEEFLSFCEENAASFSGGNQTALKKFEELLKKATELSGCSSVEKLLETLYGFNIRGVKKTQFIDLELYPKAFYQNFPKGIAFTQAKQGTASSDTLRKLLIFLQFYIVSLKLAEENEADDPYDDFMSEIDDMLYECAYVPLYARNPYDMIFFLAAAAEDDGSKNPWLEQLHNVLSFVFTGEAKDTDEDE